MKAEKLNIEKIVKSEVDEYKRNEAKKVRFNSKGESDQDKKTKFTDEQAFAYMIDHGPHSIYRVRAKYGRGDLYDPLEGSNRRDMLHGRDSKFQFRRVSKPCFDNYVDFLKNRRVSSLRVAQRQANDSV